MAVSPAHERELVSMVSSLIHLRTIGEELKKKPFVIPRMERAMAATLVEFDALQAQFLRTEEALQTEAAPYLQQWLAAQRLNLGGEFRLEGGTLPAVVYLRGRLASIRLHPRAHHGLRYVELSVDEAGFSLSARGPYRPREDWTNGELAPVLSGGFMVALQDKCDSFKVVLPIKKADLDSLATALYSRYRIA